MKFHLDNFVLGLVAIFSTGGVWFTTGLADQYPQLTPWLTVALAILTLLINARSDHKEA